MGHRLTQAAIDELAKRTAHATIADIDATPGPEATAAFLEDLGAYLSSFAARKRDESGDFAKGNPCIVCDKPLQGDLLQQFIGDGGFTWGFAHGAGFCRYCRWPARLYHFVKDRNGADLVEFRHVVLQVHPEHVTTDRLAA